MICYRFFMTLFYRDKLPIMRPSQGFGGFREKGYLVSEIWGEGSFILRDLERKHNFLEQKDTPHQQLLMSLIYKAGLYYAVW